MTTQFWSNDPSVLLNNTYIYEIWPTNDMCYEQKLNAITRCIILVTILGYIFTFSFRLLIVGILTLIMLIIVFNMKKPKITAEPFQNNENTISNPVTLETFLKSEFKEGNKTNPFSNVLLTDIADDPNRKSAPPAFNPSVETSITKNVKKAVQKMNPEIKNTNRQLYDSLWDNFELDQSNRNFYSTPNTKVENDQSAYAEFLYGNMYSAKESTPEGNLQRVIDNPRYTLY